MRAPRRSLGYGAYGQNPFAPNFVICKSEGGTANCPSEYVKEFSGLSQMDWFFSTRPAGEAAASGVYTGNEPPRLYRKPRRRRFWDYLTGRGAEPDTTQPMPVATAPVSAPPPLVVQTLTLPGVPTAGGTVVQGTPNLTQREVLSTPGQTTFTRTTDTLDANIPWNDWRRLKEMLPANFNEAKYLQNNPDVAKAVQAGAMPSGAWHYVMYGMPSCQAGQKEGKKCEARSFAGWRNKQSRRPGYLAGYSPWK